MNTDLLIEALRRMLLIRLAEQTIADDFIKNKIFSFLHLSIGQEAVAVGTALALQKGDRMWGNHRSHAHYLSMGGNLYRMFCEIYGKADGCCKGYGGSMHMLDRNVGFMGSTPILGSVAPIATGSAFEQKASKSENISVCFIGDGASEEGVVYESVNLAAVMKLPVLFVIENNLYAVSTDFSVRRAERFSYGQLYTALGAHFFGANGNAFIPMYQTVSDARKAITTKGGPAVVEARVFRHMAHSGPIFDDAAGYRKVDTKEVREEADPIKNVMSHIRGKGVSAESLERIHGEVKEQVRKAFDAAQSAPTPAPAAGITVGVYA